MVASIDVFRYSLFAASHLLADLSESEIKKVRSVLLFGSVARGTPERESDIDLFFDVEMPRKGQLALRAKLNKAAEKFSLSNTALAFKLRGTENEISIKIGKLEEWPDLAQAISTSGIILYQKYTKKPPALKGYAIFSWEHPGKSKGALLNKLYGYRAKKKFYPGLLRKAKGIKLGRATIMVPAAHRDLFIAVFEKYNISYSRRDVWGQ